MISDCWGWSYYPPPELQINLLIQESIKEVMNMIITILRAIYFSLAWTDASLSRHLKIIEIILTSSVHLNGTNTNLWTVIRVDCGLWDSLSIIPREAFSVFTSSRNIRTRSRCGIMWGIFCLIRRGIGLPLARSFTMLFIFNSLISQKFGWV